MSQNRNMYANSDIFGHQCDAGCRYKENNLAAATTGGLKLVFFNQKATIRELSGKASSGGRKSLLGLYAFQLAFFTMVMVKKICLEAYRPGGLFGRA